MNLKYKEPVNRNYGNSIIVDSIKVRLLEKGESTMIKKDNKNVAIGKSGRIGGALNWLPKDEYFFPKTKKDSIRALFIERMGNLLPRKHKNPKAFQAIHLPASMGGYGLGDTEDINLYLDGCPSIIQAVANKALQGESISAESKILRKLNTNPSSRGISKILEFKDKIINQLEEYPTMVNAINFGQLRNRFPEVEIGDNRRILFLAQKEGLLSFSEFADFATRGNLFQSLIMGEEKLKNFNTVPYVKTLKKIWDVLEDEYHVDIYENDYSWRDMEPNTVFKILSNPTPQWFFDINQTTSMDVGYWDPQDPDSETWDFKDDINYLSKYSMKTPNMGLDYEFVGINKRAYRPHANTSNVNINIAFRDPQ
jgi:hypothetical protein